MTGRSPKKIFPTGNTEDVTEAGCDLDDHPSLGTRSEIGLLAAEDTSCSIMGIHLLDAV